MGNRIAIIVVVDGLRADGLGCYGNARASTPFLDRLATESVVCDFAYCLDPTLASFYGAALLGLHPVYRFADTHHTLLRQASHTSLGESARHFLVTDDPAVAALDLRPLAWTDACTLTPDDTYSLASPRDATRCFESAVEWLNARFATSAAHPDVAWVHTSQLARVPLPDDATAATPAARERYDAAVTAVDEGIRTLFSLILLAEEPRDVLFTVIGGRGRALGERANVGGGVAALHEEWLHVPLIVHHAESGADPYRSPRLVSPIDLHALLSRWPTQQLNLADWGTYSSAQAESGTPAGESAADWLLIANAQGDRALRTPGWYLIQPPPVAGNSPEGREQPALQQLYLKPDDRWECNEVLDRRPEIAVAMSDLLQELLNQAAAGAPMTLPPLPAELIKGG